MVAPVNDTQPSDSPAISTAPKILIVDDEHMKITSLKSSLERLGYDVHLALPEDAAAAVRTTKFDLVIVDGKFSDRRYDEGGLSARFIREHLQGTHYGRFTGSACSIPASLQGEFNEESTAADNIVAWVTQHIPIVPKLPDESFPPRITPHTSLEEIE